MSKAITREHLARGYILALEQCGLLLKDACALYERRSFATTMVLTAFAWKELGRADALLVLWRNGSHATISEIKARLKNHEKSNAPACAAL